MSAALDLAELKSALDLAELGRDIARYQRDALFGLIDRTLALDTLSPASRVLEERELAKLVADIRLGQMPLGGVSISEETKEGGK
jgi:hypothetical protein